MLEFSENSVSMMPCAARRDRCRLLSNHVRRAFCFPQLSDGPRTSDHSQGQLAEAVVLHAAEFRDFKLGFREIVGGWHCPPAIE